MEAVSTMRLTRSVVSGGLLAGALIAGTPAYADITFQFNYLDPANFGFNDTALGATRRAALEDAAAKYSSMFATHFSNSGTIVIDVTGMNNPASSTLASAGSEMIVTSGTPPGFNLGEVIRLKLQTGTDVNGAEADGTVKFNFAHAWDYSYGAGTDTSKFDFYSVMYHELTHAVGFSSTINPVPPYGVLDPSVNWVAFDQFITDKDGNRVINPATFLVDATVWDNIKLKGILADGQQGIYFSGPNSMLANGGKRVPIYSADPWADGSSGSHVADYAPYDEMLMRWATGPGDGPLDFSAVEVGMLKDIGYVLGPVPEPESYGMMLAGLGVLAWVVRRRKG